jgi:predicted O-linked N-acetylglucosamine transferase (SPINDLY family)
MPLPEHQERLRLADLFLDTLPYNAGATASDTLWAGLPVLTRIGETFVGRMAASVLNAIRLPELVTTTSEDYERLAIDLATHPEKLAVIKRKLAENRLATPLFDTKLFTKHIEAAYTAMYERCQAGLAPDHIAIPN